METISRKELHGLLARIPDIALMDVKHFLESLIEDVDEDVDDDLIRLIEARKRGPERIPHEDVLRRQFPNGLQRCE